MEQYHTPRSPHYLITPQHQIKLGEVIIINGEEYIKVKKPKTNIYELIPASKLIKMIYAS